MSFADNTIDLPSRNFLSSEFGTKLQRKVPLFLEVPEFSYITVQDRLKETAIPTTSSIRSSVSIKLQLVSDTDRQTDTEPWHIAR